ncbi:hypothetical protein J2X01_000309 [Arthrobacter ginsengisoli]|uniref:DUF4231 domain-containing protein n=1 Tax=Arthrobacter ginsengisoli TaxID=1356565 RepID=A0ABU1U7E8_9MICC|nr:hypothetical protein [Arthrobacter ginsengisoli]MDR7081040.1 hypothetical protein [Arthrobacter ginsengisoli]
MAAVDEKGCNMVRATTPPLEDSLPVERHGRMYGVSILPIISPVPISADSSVSREVLRMTLTEASASWRMLTEVRFKLLALLPTISALALFAIVSPAGALADANTPVRVAAAGFGFFITLGIWIYDRRNDELYNELISRARRAEFELGIDTGVFRGRPKPRAIRKGNIQVHVRLVPLAKRLKLIKSPKDPISVINHGIAVQIIYGSVLAAWVLAGVSAAFGWVP